MFIVVAYDIASDRRRTRLVKYLKDFGERVNYSVFQCEVKPEIYPKMRTSIEEIIDLKEDSVLFYELCGRCQGKGYALGVVQLSRPTRIVAV